MPRLLPPSALLPILLCLFPPSAGLAQFTPFKPGVVPAAINGLDITPDGGSTFNLTVGGTGSLEFIAHNGLNTAGTYTFTCSATGVARCGAVIPTSATIAAGANRVIDVSVTAPSAGTGRITLTATPSGETGFINISAQSPGPATVTLRNQNGDNHDRSLCLATGAGEGAFVQCGDLVATQGMPGFATLSKERSIVLLYNSRTAGPRPVVTAAVNQPAGRALPTSVFAELTVGGVVVKSATYTAWTSATRQIALDYDALAQGHTTGVYPFSLLVRNQYASGPFDATVTGTLVIVDRSASEFGRGWSLAGVEQIFTDANADRRIWVAGDGSIRLFYRGAPITAGMLTQSGFTSFNATLATDRLTGATAWTTAAGTASGSWVRVDFGASPRTVTRLGVHSSSTSNPATYDVQYSDDAAAWTTVFTGLQPAQGWRHATWTAAGAHRYWRLLLANAPGGASPVTELTLGAQNIFYGAPGDTPDSLVVDSVSTSPSFNWYRRDLRHRAAIQFDATGRHRITVNRAGHQTTFNWTTVAGALRLTSIVLPPTAGMQYTLTYDLTTGKLDQISDPGGRVLNASVVSGELRTLLDPDNRSTGYVYDGSGRMTQRTSRRSFVNRFEYAKGNRVTKVTVASGRTLADTMTSVTQLDAWDERGLAVAATGQVGVDTAKAYTRVLGPRYPGVTDTAAISVDRWGAPSKIVNGIGATTRIVRGDPFYPALVTQVTYPNNRIATLAYDGRGNLVHEAMVTAQLGVDSVPRRVRTYAYTDPDEPDSPAFVRDSIGGTVRATEYRYNSDGFTDLMIDPRGHRTSFVYATAAGLKGLVLKATEEAVETWHETGGTDNLTDVTENQVRLFRYDTKGNVIVDSATTGVRTTFVRDAFGRVSDVDDPVGVRVHHTYDKMNRDTLVSRFIAQNFYNLDPLAGCRTDQVLCTNDSTKIWDGLPQALTTVYHYGINGADSVNDARAVPRGYRYDARDRVMEEVDDYNQSRFAFYDRGGLLTRSLSRSGQSVRFYYDAIGRRTAMAYDSTPSAFPSVTAGVHGDSISYTYDLMGNLTLVKTRIDTITRTYFGDGSVRQKITSLGPAMRDTLVYRYDAVGARVFMRHGRDSVVYAYGNGTGTLDRMSVWAGARELRFLFEWDQLGRRRKITYPTHPTASLMTVQYRYDAAGLLRRLVSTNPTPGALSNDPLQFTFRNLVVDPVGRVLRDSTDCKGINADSPCGTGSSNKIATYNAYDMSAQLVRQLHREGSTIFRDSMGYDASGNMKYQRRARAGETHVYQIDVNGAHNRVKFFSRTELNGSQRWIEYTLDGSRQHEYQNPPIINNDERWFYYDGLGRMSGTTEYILGQTGISTLPESCRYDGDGQMVGPCDGGAPFLAYDGNNVAATMTIGGTRTIGWHFFQGPGLDDPLMGFHRTDGTLDTGATTRLLFYVTDGSGHQLAVADSAGNLTTSDKGTGRPGMRYAGGTKSARSFDADRFNSASAPKLSFFRNRAFDLTSGRWTQEDPIGVAGGVNLYQYSGNNPVTFADPFGLGPCTIEDRSGCEFLKVTVSVGLLAPGARFKAGGAQLKGSAGFTAAASGSLSFGNAGVSSSAKLSAGVSAEGSASVGGTGVSGSVGCSMTTNNTGGCKGSVQADYGDMSADKGNIEFGASIGPVRPEVKIGIGDYLVSALGTVIDAAKGFFGTLNYVQGIVPGGE